MAVRIGAGSVSRRLSERARAASSAGIDTNADMFGRLRQMVEQITQAVTAASQVAEDAQTQTGAEATKTGRIVFGYNVSVGLDGLHVEPFGDVQPAEAARAAHTRRKDRAPPPAPASRAPIVDVFEEDGAVRIVAELPGVSDADITCHLSGLELHISTAGSHRYGKIVQLPWLADMTSLTQRCQNGILEVRLTQVAVP